MKKLVAVSIVAATALTVGDCAEKDDSANIATNANVMAADNMTTNETVAVDNTANATDAVQADANAIAAAANTTNSN
jgi:hypothetical protein